MAEFVSKVYDIIYPSPVTLQEISLFAVTVQIWRWELKQYGGNDVMEKLYPEGKSNQNISLPDVISNLPSTIDYMIKKYHKKLVVSIDQWLRYNFRYIFQFHRENRNDILKDFNDIACDVDGTVHYDRTAKRMLHCDRISLVEKFMIACAHCFEDDIRQIWSSVESKMELNKIDFDDYPHVYYWVCRLRNEMDKIPDLGDDTIEETIFACDFGSRSTFEYFWNRLSLEKQSEIAIGFCGKEATVAFNFRYILPKLNEEQKAQFLYSWFYELMESESNRKYIPPIWMCIKDNMKEIIFKKLAKSMVLIERALYIAEASSEQASNQDEIFMLCCDLWNSVTDHLKQSAIKYIFDDSQLLRVGSRCKFSHRREMRFLFTVLSNATLEDRLKFWRNNWLNLLKSTRLTDFLKIMKICLNEEQIHEFKETTMSKYENIKEAIKPYFSVGCIQELKDFVNFCCPDQNSRRILNQKIVQSDFFNMNHILNEYSIHEAKLMREFIDDIYTDDPDFPTDFNINLDWFLKHNLAIHMEFFSLNSVIWFVDTFASYIQNLDEIKKGQFVETLRTYIISGPIYEFHGEEVRKFLFWCLDKEDENEMVKFKQSISPDQVLRNMLRNGKRRRNEGVDPDTHERIIEYPPTLDPFLSWYFATPEEIDEFKIRLTDVFKWIAAPGENVF